MDKEELDKSEVTMKHFEEAMSRIEPMSSADLDSYNRVLSRFGRVRRKKNGDSEGGELSSFV